MSGDLAEPGPVISYGFPGPVEIRDDTYVVASTILFPGSKRIGWPKYIQAILMADVAATPGDIRIYDLTNSKVIVEKIGINNITPQIIDLGPISNVPNEPAIWEIQIRVPSLLPNDLVLYSISLIF